MPIYCHFLSKSEYQFEKNLIKHVAFSALSKNVSPPPCSMTIPQVPSGGGGGASCKNDTGFIETKSDALL